MVIKHEHELVRLFRLAGSHSLTVSSPQIDAWSAVTVNADNLEGLFSRTELTHAEHSKSSWISIVFRDMSV